MAIDLADPASVESCDPQTIRAHEPVAISRGMRIAIALTIIIPLIGFVAGVALLWEYGLSIGQLVLFLIAYAATGIGITMGFHRLFTHCSFETSRPVRAILAIVGSMAVEGPVLKWVAMHRIHHQFSDVEQDPHSPHLHGGGFKALLSGLWHSHMGWLFAAERPDWRRYVADYENDRLLQVVNNLFVVWVALGLVIPAAIGGLISGSWMGVLIGFVWSGLARVFLVHHVTWSINSACHVWGRQPFRSHDQSRNNAIFGILAFGEGWHNTHHAFPTSARHGMAWWEFDITWVLIRGMEMIGLVRRVRIPDADRLAAKRTARATA